MSRLLHPSHRAAEAHDRRGRPALLFVLAVALSLVVLVSAVAAVEPAPALYVIVQPNKIGDAVGWDC
jgi:hypothetical protein